MSTKLREKYLAPKAFYQKIAGIALPLAAQQILNQGAGFVDTLMVSYIGYVSAVTVASELNNLMFLLGFGINSAISVYASQFYGIRDWKNLRRAFGLFISLNMVAATLFFILAQVGNTRLLAFYSKDAVLVSQAWEYLSISSISFFFMCLTNAFSFMYRSVQNPKVPMVIGIGVNLSNALLNYLLIFGKLGLPEMGARGAAMATVIATGGMAQFITPLCRRNVILEKDLLLKGLNIIYKKNTRVFFESPVDLVYHIVYICVKYRS